MSDEDTLALADRLFRRHRGRRPGRGVGLLRRRRGRVGQLRRPHHGQGQSCSWRAVGWLFATLVRPALRGAAAGSLIADGFLQEHRLCGTTARRRGRWSCPACMVATVAGDQISHLHEYLDPGLGRAAVEPEPVLAATVAEAARRFGDHPAFATPGSMAPQTALSPAGRPEPSASSTSSATKLPSGLGRLRGGGRLGAGPGPALDARVRGGLRGLRGQAGRHHRCRAQPRGPPSHERAAMIEVIDPTLILATPALAAGLPDRLASGSTGSRRASR